MKRKLSILTLFLTLLTFSSVFALTNNDFETGDFTDWFSGGEGVNVVSSPSPMDSYSAIINGSEFATESNGGFGQDFSGSAYNISFYCKGSFNSTGDVNGKLIVRTSEWSQGYGDDISAWCNYSTWQHIELIPTNSSTTYLDFLMDVVSFPNPHGNWFMIDNVTVCGDGDCQGDENETNCCMDCGTPNWEIIGEYDYCLNGTNYKYDVVWNDTKQCDPENTTYNITTYPSLNYDFWELFTECEDDNTVNNTYYYNDTLDCGYYYINLNTTDCESNYVCFNGFCVKGKGAYEEVLEDIGGGIGGLMSGMGTPLVIFIILMALGSAVGYIFTSFGKGVGGKV